MDVMICPESIRMLETIIPLLEMYTGGDIWPKVGFLRTIVK